MTLSISAATQFTVVFFRRSDDNPTMPITFPTAGRLLVMVLLLMCGTTNHAQSDSPPPAPADPIQRATDILLEAAQSDRALLRMNAVEACKVVPDRALPLVQLGIDDPNPAVRFAALTTAGRLEFGSLGDRALAISADAAQPNYVRAAAAYAAHRCGLDADLSILARMLWDPDPRQRSNAALLLGLAGSPSAIPLLAEASEDPMRRIDPLSRALVRLQIAEALLTLGHEDSLQVIRGAAYSSQPEVQILAVLMLGRAGDRGMQGNLIQFLAKRPIELSLAAADGLANMGSLEGVPVMLAAAGLESPTVRSQAAFALGKATGDERVPPVLHGLLIDPDPAVRLSAAAAVLEADARAGG
jgi:HEAT repeat protein